MADVTEKSLDDFFAKRDKKKKKEKTKTKEAIPIPAQTVLVKKIKKEKEKSAKNENPDAPVEKVSAAQLADTHRRSPTKVLPGSFSPHRTRPKDPHVWADVRQTLRRCPVPGMTEPIWGPVRRGRGPR